MDINSLFPLSNNIFEIRSDLTTDPVLSDTLSRLTNGTPILVRDAQRTRDPAKQQVVIIGKANILNVTDVDTTVIGKYDASGVVVLTVFFRLIKGQPTPQSWKFSTSFRDLPSFKAGRPMDKTKSASGSEQPNFLDTLILSNASFVLSTDTGGTDDQSGADYAKGFYFVSNYLISGVSGMITTLLGGNTTGKLSGPIVMPKAGEVTPPLVNVYQRSWNYNKPAPGIYLGVDLGIHPDLTDKLAFEGVFFKIYSPVSKDWVKNNNTYYPITALYSSLSIPSASITADLLCINPFSSGNLAFYGMFEGITIGKLADLIDLAGADDFTRSLPSDVQSGLSTLSKLELECISLQLGQGMKVISAGVTIGIRSLNTKILPGFEIKSLAASFYVMNPFDSSRSLNVVLDGTIDFLGATFDTSLDLSTKTATASLQGTAAIPLKSLFTQAGLPAPSDLTISMLNLAISADGSYNFAGGFAPAPGWTIGLGPVPLTIEDLTVVASRPAGGVSNGKFSGMLKVSDALTLYLSYDSAGPFYFKSELPDASLKGIIAALTNQSLVIPDSFDLHFTDSSVLVQGSPGNVLFQLATNINSVGFIALQVQKINANWGIAFGVDLISGPSALPGLSFLSYFETMFPMSKFMLVVSSFGAPSFDFPDTASFNDPNLGTKNVKLPSQASTLVAGLNVYAQWTVNAADKNQNLLQKFLGTSSTLGITLQVGKVPSQNSKLFVSYQTKIMGHPLTCQFGGMITNGKVGLFLSGSMTVSIQGQPQTFDVVMLFVTNGAFLSATMKGKTSVNFSVFKLSNLALEVGINFEGIPSLGVAATIDVSTFESSIAVFFDSADPSQSLLAGAVSDLHLGDVLNTFTQGAIPSGIDSVLNTVAVKGTNSFVISDADGSLADDLNNLKLNSFAAQCQAVGKLTIPSSQSQFLLVVNTAGSLWYYTDMTKMRHYCFSKSGNSITVTTEAQFYCAPQATNIGTIAFPQGFYINGAIEFLGITASMTLDIDTSRGISLDAAIDKPIIIGDKKLFSITDTKGNTGPVVSLSTYNDPAKSKPEFRPPHFYIDGQITILGMDKSVLVSVSSSGASFDIHGTIVPMVQGTLTGKFNGLTDLKIGGDINVGVKDIDLGSLGTFKIGTGADCGADIYVKGSDIGADLTASFELAGNSLSLGTIKLDVATQTLADLPVVLFNAIKDFLIDLFKDPKKWADYAVKALGWAQDKVESVLTSVFPGLTKDQAAAILTALFPVCAVTQALTSL
jgi:hypothetical protein